MTTTNDDREALAALLGDHGYDMECIGGFKRAADRVLAAGFRRAPSAPSAPTPPEAGSDADQLAGLEALWEDARAKIAELERERDAALADAARLREALVDIAYPYGGDFAGTPAHYTTTRERARTALAATAAPAAKEG